MSTTEDTTPTQVFAAQPQLPSGPQSHLRRTLLIILAAVIAVALCGTTAWALTQQPLRGSRRDAEGLDLGPGHSQPTVKPTHKVIVVRPTPARTVYVPVPANNPPSAIVNAQAVVTQYYADITAQDYQAAWNLGGSNLSGGQGYNSWAAGYDTTASISLGTFSYWGSDSVQVAITALQTDGSYRYYTGTYTVSGGQIVSANIAQDGSTAPAGGQGGQPATGLVYAGIDSLGGYVYASTATSASFAVAVADAYAGGGGSDYETVYSAVTGQSYGISYANVGNLTIEATGGNGVLVQFTVNG